MATVEQSLALFSGNNDWMKKTKNMIAKVYDPKVIANFSDEFINTQARLDAVRVTFNDGGSIAEIQKRAMVAAQRSRTAYTDTVNNVSKLALNAQGAFDSFEEAIVCQELITKEFKLGSAAIAEQKVGMTQLIDAMAAGALTEKDMTMLLQTAPDLVENLAEHMGVPIEQMGTLAAQGLITAEEVKNAMFGAAEEINGKISEMPATWNDAWTNMKNTAMYALEPLLAGINWLANSIDMIGPPLLGLGGAFAVFKVGKNWADLSKKAVDGYNEAVKILSIGFGMLRRKQEAIDKATGKWDSRLLSSPITWYVMAIMVLVGVLYAVVAIFNKVTDSVVSATGIITGAFASAGAYLINRFIVPLWDKFAAFANFLLNCLKHPIASIKILFIDLAMIAVGKVRNIIHAIESLVNCIPGVNLNLTSGIDKIYDSMKNEREKIAWESGWTEYVKPMEYIDYESAAKKGYKWGENFKDGIAENFGFGGMDYSAMMNGNNIDYAAMLAGNSVDYSALQGNGYSKQSYFEPRYDDFNLSDDTLEYLQKMAGAAKGDHYTTVNVNIEQNNNNKIESKQDAIDVMGYWAKEFGDTLAVSMNQAVSAT